jgi:hypothetical protein
MFLLHSIDSTLMEVHLLLAQVYISQNEYELAASTLENGLSCNFKVSEFAGIRSSKLGNSNLNGIMNCPTLAGSGASEVSAFAGEGAKTKGRFEECFEVTPNGIIPYKRLGR